MYRVVPVGGAMGSEGFLLITEGKTALIDSGFAFSGAKMVENIKRELGERPLDYVLLTHSHGDHASGSPFCKDEWPDVKIVSSEYAARVFTRPGALETIYATNATAEKVAGLSGYKPARSPLAADITVKDGDIIDLGSMKLRALALPGHTKCSIGFFSEEERLLIACETLGVISSCDGDIRPAFLVSYGDTQKSIQRAAELNPKAMILPHFGLVDEEVAKRYLKDAPLQAKWLKDMIIEMHLAGAHEDEIFDAVRENVYLSDKVRFQTEEAFALNTRYMIPMLIRECLGEEA